MSNYIKPIGPRTAKIALYGEAPGKQELAVGQPFVGPTGQLNDELLQATGILRNEIFISNVWKSAINNKPKNFPYNLLDSPLWERYTEQIEQELNDLSDVNIIIACGELALYILTGEKGITKKRGSVYSCIRSKYRKIKVIGSLHPSSALPFRQFCNRYLIMHDYERALEESKFSDFRYPKRNIMINPTFPEVISWLKSLTKEKELHCDIESPQGVGEVTHICFGPNSQNSMSIPFKISSKNNFSLDEEIEIWDNIAYLLENPNITIVGHNFSFDMTYLYRKYGIRTTNIKDSIIAQGIAYAGLPTSMKPKGLGFVASIHTKENYFKDDGKQQNITGIGNDDMYQTYNAKDGCVTQESEKALEIELKQFVNNYEQYIEGCKLIEPLVYMSEHGIKVDDKKLAKRAKEYEEELESIKENILNVIGYDINLNSTQQLKKLFYEERKHKPYIKKGKSVLDVNALKRLAAKDPIAKKIQRYRFLKKRHGTYLTMKLSEDKRFKCSYNAYLETNTIVKKSGGTRQGRLSSSKSIFNEGMNAQNLPDEVLDCLIPDDGYVTFNIDLSQAENRIVAYIAPDSQMIEAFETEADIHSITASSIFGISAEEVTDKPPCSLCINAGIPETCGHKGDRFWGKKANHSLNYDEGPNLYALINEIPVAEAKRQIRSYHALYQGVRQMHNWIRSDIRSTQTLINPFGRAFYFMDMLTDKLFKQAYSYIPQTTVAHIINSWGILHIWNNMPDVELQAQVHDSIRFQMKLSLGWNEVVKNLLEIKNALEQEIQFKGFKWTIPCDCEIGLDFFNMEKVNLNQPTSKIICDIKQLYEILKKDLK